MMTWFCKHMIALMTITVPITYIYSYVQVTVWWWWRRRFEPFADELFVPIGTRVHVESVNAREASLLLPELIASYRALRRRESGGLGDVGECACVTNSSGEALAVLPLRDVEESARRDTPFELRQLGIDINPQMYQYRGKVTLLAGIVKAYIEEERPMRITLALLYVHVHLMLLKSIHHRSLYQISV